MIDAEDSERLLIGGSFAVYFTIDVGHATIRNGRNIYTMIDGGRREQHFSKTLYFTHAVSSRLTDSIRHNNERLHSTLVRHDDHHSLGFS